MDENYRTHVERTRAKLRKAAEDSGLSFREIGKRMGYQEGGARQAVSRLLTDNRNVSKDPALSTLLAFAHAIDRPLAEIIR